jgi:hypothetical protein
MKQCEMDSRVEHWGQVKCKLGKLSLTLNEKSFCIRLIELVNVMMVYQDNIDEAIEKSNESGVITMDRHSKVGLEELLRKLNIGLQMAKDMPDASTQHTASLDSSSLYVKEVESGSLTLTQAKVTRNVVH